MREATNASVNFIKQEHSQVAGQLLVLFPEHKCQNLQQKQQVRPTLVHQ
jgi:hypothetical protein